MAKNSGMRGTPRAKAPKDGASPIKARTSRPKAAPRPARATKPRAASVASAATSKPKAAAKPKLVAPKPRKAKRAAASSVTGRPLKATKRGTVATSAKAPTIQGSGRLSSSDGSAPKGSKPSLADRVKGVFGATAVGAATVATAAASTAAAARAKMTPEEARRQRQGRSAAEVAHIAGNVLKALLALAVVAVIAFFVLRDSPVFRITQIEAEPTDHISSVDIGNLVSVPEGTTLLNVDEAQIQEDLSRNPWVGSVSIERAFPNTLRINVTERRAYALVVMSTSSTAWYLGEGDVWMEPAKISVEADQSVNAAALARATQEGLLLITDVPASVNPTPGNVADDAVLEAVADFRSGFSADFSAQVVSYSASSVDAISCVLGSGVEVSLGSASNISAKEEVVTQLTAMYPGELTYINVRVPSNPAYRRIGSGNVQPGTGAAGDDVTDEPPVEDVATSADTGDSSTSDTATSSDTAAEQ